VVSSYNSIIDNFMVYEEHLKQIYCSYTRTQKIQWFSIILLLFEVVAIGNPEWHVRKASHR